jgi:hypothetical protein
MSSYITTRVELHIWWGPRLRTSVRRGWMDLLGHSSWFPGTEVDGGVITIIWLNQKVGHEQDGTKR